MSGASAERKYKLMSLVRCQSVHLVVHFDFRDANSLKIHCTINLAGRKACLIQVTSQLWADVGGAAVEADAGVHSSPIDDIGGLSYIQARFFM